MLAEPSMYKRGFRVGRVDTARPECWRSQASTRVAGNERGQHPMIYSLDQSKLVMRNGRWEGKQYEQTGIIHIQNGSKYNNVSQANSSKTLRVRRRTNVECRPG